MIMGSKPFDAVGMLQFALVNQRSIFMSLIITITILASTAVDDNALFIPAGLLSVTLNPQAVY